MLYTGLCHSDTLWARGVWGDFAYYPCVPGHEVVGEVLMLGGNVEGFKIGDKVGFGFCGGACGKCKYCHQGNDNLCEFPNVSNFHKHFGGWATHYQGKARFAHKIPDSIPIELAPGLFCAGMTVFTPMRRVLKAGMNLGIVGIGGLGHIAIKFGKAMGCFVTGITTSKEKVNDIIDLGGDAALLEEDIPEAQKKRPFDAILCCISDGDFDKYIKLLKKRGVFMMVGLPPADRPNHVDINFVVLNEIVISGTLIGNCEENEDLLVFAAKNKIFPMVEVFDFDDFPKAVHRLEKEKPRYRIAIKCESQKYPKFNQ